MVSSISFSSAAVTINRDPHHLTKFEDPFTHKPLDKPAIVTAIEGQNKAAESSKVNILA
jgi:hypothetical protein